MSSVEFFRARRCIHNDIQYPFVHLYKLVRAFIIAMCRLVHR